jgi:hypothetical protein
MLRVLLLTSAILAAQDPAVTPPVIDKPDPTKVEAAEARALAEYNAVRDKTPETAAAQWKLAVWCEEKGLKPEAYVHYGRVIELDPKREAAWQKLGFKKHDGRWMTPAQINAEEAQKKAEKTWLVQLKKWHKDIHGGKKQAEAQAAIDAITAPSAVSSVYREFGAGGSRDQEIAVQILGQIESAIASKTLALLAVYGKSPAVRRLATETLRSRKSEEYLDLLVGLMKDILKYEVRPVGGPGSPGVLFVEGERFNVRRFYAAPPPAGVAIRPGDIVTYDANGLPLVTRSGIVAHGTPSGVPGSKTLVRSQEIIETDTFSYSGAILEAQKAAAVSQTQLAGDVSQFESINRDRKQFNEVVMGVAKAASGKNPGETAKDWRDSLAVRDRRYARQSRPRTVPTIDEMVELGYVPNPAATVTAQLSFVTRTYVDS